MIDLPTLQNYSVYILLCMGVAFVIAGILLTIAENKMEHVEVSDNMTLTETLRSVPLVVVLAIDLLDFALDFMAMPLVWIILQRYGLSALRNVSAIEALIPGTQAIPTLTLAWIAVNYLGIEF